MTRIILLLSVVAVAACSQRSDERAPDASTEHEERTASVKVDFRFARVIERHPALDSLLDFIASDDLGASEFEGLALTDVLGSRTDERVLEGANREAVEGYLQSVLAREPQLALPEGIDLAFGTVPPRRPDGGAKESTRAYWLDTTSQIEVTQIRSASVVTDNIGMNSVKVTLEPPEREAFGQLTRNALGHKIAIVRGDEVISAPQVNEAITEGVLLITMANPAARGGPDGPDALARRLLGGVPNPEAGPAPDENNFAGLRWLGEQ